MKRILILVALLVVAGIAGIVRSHSKISDFNGLISQNNAIATHDEIRKTFPLAPGAMVELSGINGAIKIETSDTTTAEVLVERTGSSPEALSRRKIMIDADTHGLRIHGEKGDVGFFARLFGSSPTERITLNLPRQISLQTKGVNGSVVVGELEGSVDVRGVNGRVQIASAEGTAEFKGINGNIMVGLKQLNGDGVNMSGINGNIELQLSQGVNADLDAHGMNGRVFSDLAEVIVDKNRHGNYSARIGTGGSAITAKGINGNIRITRAVASSETAGATSKLDAEKSKF
jgi:DUF4097 and DUF4098 domain-containing protein YvlB